MLPAPSRSTPSSASATIRELDVGIVEAGQDGGAVRVHDDQSAAGEASRFRGHCRPEGFWFPRIATASAILPEPSAV